MGEYNVREIEKKWQAQWRKDGVYTAENISEKPKYYVLDMFPYPSGAGLHVGHPLGYIASDIVSRYKRLQGFNVLHPMGFDAFGLPAEQYAIQTGQHPAVTTEQNIKRYKEQLENIGFSYDWDREVRTCEPDFYKWTQWIFMQLFNSWYNKTSDKAESVDTLIAAFEAQGNASVSAVCDEDTPDFSAEAWKGMSEKEQQEVLLKYRLAFLAETTVNWCPALGSVLSHDEVKDGVSERGGHPVERKKMMQWSLRITAYADRLLQGLDTIDWPEPLKEMQRNWIGKSRGAEVDFQIEGSERKIRVFTTRVDTIFGVDFLAVAPESEWVDLLVSEDKRTEVMAYVDVAKNRSERDRMSDVKNITGVFTGGYVIHPFSGKKVPVWVADYVLAGYGTGAVMAVPAGDQRDYDFAKHFALPITPINAEADISEAADPTYEGKVINSDFLDGLTPRAAIDRAIEEVEKRGIGKARIQYRLRDAIFTRQRYWGEPLPVYFKEGMPYLLSEEQLPLVLPEVDKYLPTESGEPPLGRADNWHTAEGHALEMSTMPGWAGSSWYFYRYMDPKNDAAFADQEVLNYWKEVDLYIGGSEHATGHLLYSRFWVKFLYDLGLAPSEEPFQKLINQGMIQGRSNFVYRVKESNTFVSHGLRKEHDTVPMHVDVNIVKDDVLDLEAFKKWRPDLANAEFILEDGKYHCGVEVEKMSKSKYNVVNPDDIIARYGADTLRMYEMFLGPLEQFKPWNTNGIDGVYKFLRKFWGQFFDEKGALLLSDAPASKAATKAVHETVKKVQESIERYSFNTCVSDFMICVNTLKDEKCHNRELLQMLTVALCPFAPHIAEELWHTALAQEGSVTLAPYPAFDPAVLVEDSVEYPISINGKMRTKISFPATMSREEIEQEVLANEVVQKWTEGKPPKKVIVVPKKIVNVVL